MSDEQDIKILEQLLQSLKELDGSGEERSMDNPPRSNDERDDDWSLWLRRDIPGFNWYANQNRQTKAEQKLMHKHAGIYKFSTTMSYPYQGGNPGAWDGEYGPPWTKNGWFQGDYGNHQWDGMEAPLRQWNVAGKLKVLYIDPVESGPHSQGDGSCPETDNQGCTRDYTDYFQAIADSGGGGIVRIEAVQQPYSYSHAANYTIKSELYDTHPMSDWTKTWAEYRFFRLLRTDGGFYSFQGAPPSSGAPSRFLQYLDGYSPEPQGAGMPDMALHYLGTTSFEPSGWCRGQIDGFHDDYNHPNQMAACGGHYCGGQSCGDMGECPNEDIYPLPQGETLTSGDLCNDLPATCCCVRAAPWYYYVHVIPDIPTAISPPTCGGGSSRNKLNRPLKKSNIERQKFWEGYTNDT